MRKFLRLFVDSICTPTSKTHPVSGKDHRKSASATLVADLLPKLKTLAALEVDATVDDSTMHSQRSDLLTLMINACATTMPPGFKVVDVDQQTAFLSLVLAPRRVIGKSVWSSLLKLLVRKLPGGKHFLSVKGGIGSWAPYHDMYERSAVHEADVLLYCFLMGMTCDNKFVQNFISGSAQFKNFMKFHKLFLELIKADKKADELDMESASFDFELSKEVEKFVEQHTSGGVKTAKEDVSDDADASGDDDLRLGDDDVMNLAANL
jgi:hypothetical protein